MSNTNLTSVLEDIYRKDANALEILTKLQELSHSDSDSVNIEYISKDGSTQRISVPSYKYIQSELNRISQNFDSITKSDAIIVKDSSGNHIAFNRAQAENKSFTLDDTPKSFTYRNMGGEELLSPNLMMRVPITGVTDKYMVRKLALILDTDGKLAYFTSAINGRRLDKYTTIVDKLLAEGISFQLFDSDVECTRRMVEAYGSFDVLNIRTDTITAIIDGTTVSRDVQYFKLNDLYYSTASGGRMQLRQGDNIINDDTSYCKYVVENVITNTNEIQIKRVQGFGVIKIGVGKIRMAPSYKSGDVLEIPVRPTQYCIYYLKPIDTINNSADTEWITGFGVNTSTLIDGNNQKLDAFYHDNVEDIKNAVTYVAGDKLVPLSRGIKPDAPEIKPIDFKVLQINTQKNDVSLLDSVKKDIAQKDKLYKEIQLIDAAIISSRASLANKSSINDTLILQIEQDIDNRNKERSNKVDQYNTILTNLISLNKELIKYQPKYAVRGFWTIPLPKYEDIINLTGKQEIVQFAIEYRYLSKNNTATESKSFTQDVDGKRVNSDFSNWTRILSKPRVKKINDAGVAYWDTEKLDSSDIVNTNQLSISISKGENVEIRIKSLSEAGYPHSPMESEWSTPVVIEFPDELSMDVDLSTSELDNDRILSQFQQQLQKGGFYDHLSDSLIIQGTEYLHQAASIATSFSDETGKIYDLQSYLRILKSENDTLKAIVTKAKAKAKIYITDAAGTVLQKVNNYDSIELFGGYYVDEVAKLTTPKGEIINKVFYINIENEGEADLELLPYSPGVVGERLAGIDYSSQLFADDQSYYGYLYNKSEYDSYRKYFRVPMSILSTLNDVELFNHHNGTNNPYLQLPSFQSMQTKGQYVYSRYMDISLTEKLYEKASTPMLVPVNTVNTAMATNQATYVWSELIQQAGAVGNGLLSDFCVHIDHPDLQLSSEFAKDFGTISYSASKLPTTNIGGFQNNVKYPQFSHSALFNLESSAVNGLKQLEYSPYVRQANPTANNFPKKIGFSKNDKYLIGQNTCGSYLFLGANNFKSLYTGSTIYSQGLTIKKGGSAKIMMLFQYRMTDYDGAGSQGNGNIGGFGRQQTPVNITYAKKMGLDFIIKDDSLFSFDVKVTAKYKPDSVGILGNGM
jgi:hypothetical protein